MLSFYWYAVRHYARRTWQDLPGPWPVKVAIIMACLAVPGAWDELALLALVRLCRAYRARHAQSQLATEPFDGETFRVARNMAGL